MKYCQVWKKFNFQTESNKFYTILAPSGFDLEKGVELNPYVDSEELLDREVIVIQSKELEDLPCFNIINSNLGFILEVYLMNKGDSFVVNRTLSLDEVMILISKINNFSFNSALKYTDLKYGVKSDYIKIVP